jgi:hypothetical protein
MNNYALNGNAKMTANTDCVRKVTALYKKCIKANAYKAKLGFIMGESQKIMAMYNYS